MRTAMRHAMAPAVSVKGIHARARGSFESAAKARKPHNACSQDKRLRAYDAFCWQKRAHAPVEEKTRFPETRR